MNPTDLPINLFSTHIPACLSNNLSTGLAIGSSTHHCTYLSTTKPTHLPTHQNAFIPIYQSTHSITYLLTQQTCPSTYLTNYQQPPTIIIILPIHLSNYPSTYLSIYLYFTLPIYLSLTLPSLLRNRNGFYGLSRSDYRQSNPKKILLTSSKWPIRLKIDLTYYSDLISVGQWLVGDHQSLHLWGLRGTEG